MITDCLINLEMKRPGKIGGRLVLSGLMLACVYSASLFAQEAAQLPVEQSVEATALPAPEASPEVSTEAIPETTPEAVADTPIFTVIDAPRDYLSEKIVNFSKSVDQFFGDERYFQENNKSVIQLDLTETFEEAGRRNFEIKGRAKLHLPALKKRIHFVFESNAEQQTAGEVKKDQPLSQQQAVLPEQYSASVRYEKEKESLWHFSADMGAKFQFPLDPFLRSRGSYVIPLGEWSMKIAETVFLFRTTGLGETTQLDMEYVLSPPMLFRATSTATCLKDTHNCDLRQDLSVFHTLNERAAMLYQASVIGVSKPVLEDTAYILLTRYRYRLHKNWMFFEVSPQLHFPRIDNFKLNALLQLRLEILFGGT